jgi:hypothetical protein
VQSPRSAFANRQFGAAFIVDCARHIEDLVPAKILQAKYELNDESWEALGDNIALQRAVGAQKERRIYDGTAAREKAAHALVTAVGVIDDIVKDAGSPARSRIDGTRELRAIAAKLVLLRHKFLRKFRVKLRAHAGHRGSRAWPIA